MVHVYKGINTCIIIYISWYCKITSVKGLEMLFLYYKKKKKNSEPTRASCINHLNKNFIIKEQLFFNVFWPFTIYREMN